MVRRILLQLAFALPLLAVSAVAQSPTATYIWNGSTDSGAATLASVDGQPTSHTGGWGGTINIVNGYDLALLSLPGPSICSTDGIVDPNCTGIVMPWLPNNGFLDCWTIITWGDKVWGTRADGTTMDGTQAGDFYNLPGSTACSMWNGNVLINLSEYHQFELRKHCLDRWCFRFNYVLKDLYIGGNGSVTNQ